MCDDGARAVMRLVIVNGIEGRLTRVRLVLKAGRRGGGRRIMPGGGHLVPGRREPGVHENHREPEDDGEPEGHRSRSHRSHAERIPHWGI